MPFWFQPLLTRLDIDSLIRALAAFISRPENEAITGTGTDFSGRHWVRGRITREKLTSIAERFFSIQSLHAPLLSLAAAGSKSPSQLVRPTRQPPVEINIAALPSIAVVDRGIPNDHVVLQRYRRGTYVAPTSGSIPFGKHGSFVASRAVSGDLDFSGGLPRTAPVGDVSFFDVNVAGPGQLIEDKSILPAMQAVVGTAPDVRVFNCSFDNDPLPSFGAVKQRECLSLVQDLDNFIFQNHVLVTVAAGNSRAGLIPGVKYPNHYDDPAWALGPWACSFNSLTCGAFVSRLSPNGLVTELNWPSPFCRVGPGLCDSSKPDFSAPGGNVTPSYSFQAGLGVWGLNESGLWEDWSATSYAAPLLAREVAFAFAKLQTVCERGARPFAVTVKAFLALTPEPPVAAEAVRNLAQRTLGMGSASAERIDNPIPNTAILIWQGVLDGPADIARVQLPSPRGMAEIGFRTVAQNRDCLGPARQRRRAGLVGYAQGFR